MDEQIGYKERPCIQDVVTIFANNVYNIESIRIANDHHSFSLLVEIIKTKPDDDNDSCTQAARIERRYR